MLSTSRDARMYTKVSRLINIYINICFNWLVKGFEVEYNIINRKRCGRT